MQRLSSIRRTSIPRSSFPLSIRTELCGCQFERCAIWCVVRTGTGTRLRTGSSFAAIHRILASCRLRATYEPSPRV
jgi:hypothetical protein